MAGWLPHPKPLREAKRGVGAGVHRSSAIGIASCHYPKGASPLGLVITDGSKALKQCLLTEAVRIEPVFQRGGSLIRFARQFYAAAPGMGQDF
ncbi:hypothetical protein ES708_15555 [subsurface metagenome]